MQLKELFVTRDVSALLEETHSQGEELRRSIGAFGLTALGRGRDHRHRDLRGHR